MPFYRKRGYLPGLNTRQLTIGGFLWLVKQNRLHHKLTPNTSPHRDIRGYWKKKAVLDVRSSLYSYIAELEIIFLLLFQAFQYSHCILAEV